MERVCRLIPLGLGILQENGYVALNMCQLCYGVSVQVLWEFRGKSVITV